MNELDSVKSNARILEEELARAGLEGFYYDPIEHYSNSPELCGKYVILSRFKILGLIPLWRRVIGEISSMHPSEKFYHPECPLGVRVKDDRYYKKINNFAENYRCRSGQKVELERESQIDRWDDYEN